MATQRRLSKLLGAFVLSLLMTATSCKTPVTSLNPKVYYLEKGNLERNDEGKKVSLDCKEVKQHVCLHQDAFADIYKACRLKSE